MIPSLLLAVDEHHWVLDMCGAPGSKSRHLLSLMRRKTRSNSSRAPTGCLVVNDSDSRRVGSILEQMDHGNGSGLESPAVLLSSFRGEDILHALSGSSILFDRVLCDVPCTGDGTFRKAPDLWRTWTASRGQSLHPVQLQLALHAAALTKIGGRMIYSTCKKFLAYFIRYYLYF
jgi:16S rRNA C967 or C1407 C5-methylase (RsmB/RsmF family)